MHSVTWEGLEKVILQGELATQRRIKLYSGLRDYLQALMDTGVRVEVWIDGSFSTTKPEPGDVDIVIFLHEDSTTQLKKDSRNGLDVLIDTELTLLRYEVELNVEIFGDDVMTPYWRGKFGFYADNTTPKGIPVLQLGMT